MKILIVYGTTEGQTLKITQFMEDALQTAGHQVTICDASNMPDPPRGYEAVLIGASVHMRKYQTSVTDYINRHADQLNQVPTAFFSVCLAVASRLNDEHMEVQKITDTYLHQTGWNPLMKIQVAGALKYTQYDFFKRLVMKMIAWREGRETDTSKDYEYTDWNAVKNFVREFSARAGQVLQNKTRTVTSVNPKS